MALPQDSRYINNIISMTLDAKLPEVTDNFFRTNGLFQKLYQRYAGGNSRTIRYRGGAEIRSMYIYAGMPAASYGRGETFITNTTEFQTDLQFQWKRAYAPINADSLDLARNAGDEVQIVDYAEMLATNAFNSLADLLGYMIQGTQPNAVTGVTEARSFTANDWDGLYNGVLDTGTYGGVVRTGNYGTPGFAIISNVFNAGNVPLSLSLMQQVYGAATITPAQPDLIITTQKLWNQIWALSQPSERNAPGPLRDVGFDTVRFNQAEVIQDSHCLPGTMYFLNTEFIELWILEGNDFIRRSQKDGFSNGFPVVNQDSYVDQLIIYGDLIVPGPRYQAVLNNVRES